MPPTPVIRLNSSLPKGQANLWTVPRAPAKLLFRHDPRANLTHLTALDPALSHLEQSWSDPIAAFQWLDTIGRSFLTSPVDRWVGYLSYDLGRNFEVIPEIAEADLNLPLFCFTLHCEDHVARHSDVETAVDSSLDSESSASSPETVGGAHPTVRSTFSRAEYEAAVARAMDYIRAGDIFQVNLAHRLSAPTSLAPSQIYQRLVDHSPAHYGALLDYGDFALISNSPELFLRVAPQADGSRRIITRPIKGTRPSLPGMADELLRSEKDQAELNMIIDLERNDLGRICAIGSVHVTQPRTIETHPTVVHGVATIEGVLRADVSLVDLLRATFPGGSITGAPKIRAMEIIEETEQVRRGPYCGAIGVIGPGGALELNVAIRTMILKDAIAHIHVGGGIVADSVPADEYAETLVKARAVLAALGLAPARP